MGVLTFEEEGTPMMGLGQNSVSTLTSMYDYTSQRRKRSVVKQNRQSESVEHKAVQS